RPSSASSLRSRPIAAFRSRLRRRRPRLPPAPEPVFDGRTVFVPAVLVFAALPEKRAGGQKSPAARGSTIERAPFGLRPCRLDGRSSAVHEFLIETSYHETSQEAAQSAVEACS